MTAAAQVLGDHHRWWVALGMAGQALFFSRFLWQWIVSERRGRSVVPEAFWYLSIAGAVPLLAYALWRRDPVFVTGQAAGLLVYLRNIMLISPRRRVQASGVLAAAVVLIVAGFYLWEAGRRGILSGSEARYAEIGREMLASRDWMLPRYYGAPHLDKPPVAYWLVALGCALFGVNAWGVRFFCLAAAAAALALTAALAGRLGARRGWAAAILATSGMWWMMGQTVTTDMFLTLSVTAAYAALFRLIREGPSTGRALCFWASLGVAFMIKGPIGLMVVGAPAFLWAWMERRRGNLRPFPGLFRPAGLFVFAAVAFPWFVALAMRRPELWRYWLVGHVADRFLRPEAFHRPGPLYYFIPVLAAGFLPWSFWLGGAIRRAWASSEGRLLVLWLAVPFGIFSLSASKLPAYILPLFPPAAILVALGWGKGPRKLFAAALSTGLVLSGALAAVGRSSRLSLRDMALRLKAGLHEDDGLAEYRVRTGALPFYMDRLPRSPSGGLGAFVLAKKGDLPALLFDAGPFKVVDESGPYALVLLASPLDSSPETSGPVVDAKAVR